MHSETLLHFGQQQSDRYRLSLAGMGLSSFLLLLSFPADSKLARFLGFTGILSSIGMASGIALCSASTTRFSDKLERDWSDRLLQLETLSEGRITALESESLGYQRNLEAAKDELAEAIEKLKKLHSENSELTSENSELTATLTTTTESLETEIRACEGRYKSEREKVREFFQAKQREVEAWLQQRIKQHEEQCHQNYLEKCKKFKKTHRSKEAQLVEEYRMVEAQLTQIDSMYRAKWQQTKAQYDALIDGYDSVISSYHPELEEIRESFTEQMNIAIDERNKVYAILREYERGLRFPGTNKAQDAANRIIDFLERDNIKLDAVWCERVNPADPGLYRVWVRERINPALLRAYLCNKSFEPHNPRLQCVAGVIDPVEIKLDGDRQMYVMDLRIDPKPVKRKEAVAPAYLRPVSDFPEIVEQIFSVPSSRIMGGTGGGKSSVVRLILAEKLDNDELILRLHDPLDGSPEDRWNLPKSSTSHEADRDALKALNRDRNHRLTTHQSTPLRLDIFDEIDNTTKPNKSAKEAVLEFSRDARHCGMRATFIGQYPNVKKAGYEWGEMDNFACVYLNDGAVHPIKNSPRLEAFRTELLGQYKDISKYCTTKNRELEISIKSPVAHRFALAVIPGFDPFWFELPAFTEGIYNTENILNLSELSAGYVGRDNRETSQAQSQLTAVTLTGSQLGNPTHPETHKNEGTGILPICPKCGTTSYRAKDKKSNRYYCENQACDQQTFTAKT